MEVAIFLVAAASLVVAYRLWKRRQGRAFIERYEFPEALRDKLLEEHPQLTRRDADRVLEALRQWFVVCLRARGSVIGMPSRVVDDAWHEFILMTRLYHQFCDRAFGRYLHHTPNAVAGKPIADAIPRTLQLLEKDAPAPAGGLPPLFTLDSELRVARGRDWSRAALAGGGGLTLVVGAEGELGGGCLGAGDTGGDGCGGDGCGGCGGCGCG